MKISTFWKYARIKYLWRNKRGYCLVCGKHSIFLLADSPGKIRNDGVCVCCGSCSRHRHVAKLILEEFRCKGVERIADFQKLHDVSVYNTSSQSPIGRRMGRSVSIVTSEYFDDCRPGEYKNGVLCQNVEQLTFEAEQFDLVISEDVFEHVRDWRKGFTEVHRVLKKNGVHIFSIPFFFDRATEELFEMVRNEYVLKKPVEYHGDPIRGEIPAYVHFGYDLFDCLRKTGFEVTIEISRYADAKKWCTFDCYTFKTKKM